jgi:hypothetical protein
MYEVWGQYKPKGPWELIEEFDNHEAAENYVVLFESEQGWYAYIETRKYE